MNHFSIQESITFGWHTFKKNPWIILGVTLTVAFLPTVAQYALQLPFQSTSNDEYNPMIMIGTIASLLLSLYLTVGLIKFYLKLIDGKKVEFQDIFNVRADEYLRYFLGSVVYGLIVLVGCLLLIIPGIYFAVKYQFYSYLTIDQKMSVTDSLKTSGEMTKGHIWYLILFSLALAGVSLLGFIALFVGIFVASPVIGIAQAVVYRKLSSHAKKA